MPVLDRYNLLSRGLRIVNAAGRSYPAKLRALSVYLSKALQIPSTTFYIVDKDNRYLAQLVSSSGSPKAFSCMIPLGEGIAGRCACLKAEVRAKAAALHSEEARSGDEEEFLALPVMSGDRFWGVISLGLSRGSILPAEACQSLPDILIEVAGIIQGLRLATELERKVKNLTALNDLGRQLNRTIPPQSLVPLILQSCHNYSGSCCTILRISKDKGLKAGVFSTCRASLKPYLKTLLKIGAEKTDRVMFSVQPVITYDLFAEQELHLSYLCVPLSFKYETLGTLEFFGKQEKGRSRNLDEDDREFLGNMAMLVTNALAGAANYQQMVRVSAENDKKIKELSLLYRVSNTMLSTIRLNKLMHLILTALTSGSDPFFDRAMLFLINERAGIIQGMLGVTRQTSKGLIGQRTDMEDILASRWDISEEDMIRQRDSEFSKQVRASRLELDKSLNVASRAVLEKRLIYVENAARKKRVNRDFIKRFGITSVAVAPLMAKEQAIGVVVVDNFAHSRPLTQDDLRFLQLFTNQAGMAIENSMLYNRIDDTNRSLRETQERLIQGERLAAIGEMATCIAHELKGPMVSIGGFAKRLEKKLPPASTERHYAETIIREIARLEKMLSDTLFFSKKATICYTHCTIKEIIEDSLAMVAQSLEESGIAVTTYFPRRKFSLLADCQQLKQVFINLFYNAQEAMKRGGTLKISVAAAKTNGVDAVSVKAVDSGGGIPLEVLSNIFNPFYTTKETGTGLGLPIAKRIVTNHGGKIQVNNRPGIGVEFLVILPLHP